MGDVKTAASIRTLLTNWQLLVVGSFAGFLLAAIYSIAVLASGRATRKHHIPFGPFMLAAPSRQEGATCCVGSRF